MKWTPQQYQAISATDGTLLVSAAAGSGKTAVLVERVISRLCDSEKKCSADSLLIVTFTKAATAQMRARIGEALTKKIAENPDDKYLRRQQMLLPFAKICTIDSFCGDLVRENFNKLGISPDYKILDNGESVIMREEASSQVVEELYAENSPAFCELTELFFKGRDDRELIETIYSLNQSATAYPFPEQWLESLCEPYKNKKPLDESEWGKLVKNHVSECAQYCLDTCDALIRDACNEEELQCSYAVTLAADRALYVKLLDDVNKLSWDELIESIVTAGGSFTKLKQTKRGYESPLKTAIKGGRDGLKDVIKGLPGLMCATQSEHEQDMTYCSPIVEKLVEAVVRYRNRLSQLKNEASAYEFSDISTFALSLLIDGMENGVPVKSDLACELSQRFTEILVDEYQDINEAQDMLFEAISRDGNNLFMVGDVKQSIYRFRQAMPEIFLHRRAGMEKYVDANYPATISLDKNFRSRSGVTDTVNYIFNQVMTEQTGEIDYSHGEELVAAADYPQSTSADAEVHVLDLSTCSDDGTIAQARYIAKQINDMISGGLTVQDGEGERLATYRDFCVLLRSDAGRIPVYIEQLARQGVPAYAETSGGFFAAPEISFMLSLLRVLDNPSQDIPLVAVMLSPVFGFTPDELSLMRIADRKSNVYTCLCKAANSNVKAEKFLQELRALRTLSCTLSSGALVHNLLEETGYLAVAGAMTFGARRRANLMLLRSLAYKYEDSGHIGLPGFIRFIDKLRETGTDLSTSSQLTQAADVVRIMTIHKSKGLEFPVCILADCSKPINMEDIRKNFIIHPKYGIGIIHRDAQKLVQYPTVCKKAIEIACKKSTKSEEMRVLYVALTRAKERLITVCAAKNPSSLLRGVSGAAYGGKLSQYAVGEMDSYAKWILAAVIRHPDAHAFRYSAGVGNNNILPADFQLKTVIAAPPSTSNEILHRGETAQSDAQLLEKLNERLCYEYPYIALTEIVAKHTASAFDDNSINRENFATSRPAFMSKKGLTAAQRGTALHRFMQYADYAAAAKDIEQEIERLTGLGYFTKNESEAVDRPAVMKFFESDIAKRMLASETILREKRFTISKKAYKVYPQLPENSRDEEIVIQGMVDCAFVENGELVIVDYKTDRSSPQELVDEYTEQLMIYREAMEKCMKIPVRLTVLYSFFNNTVVKIM